MDVLEAGVPDTPSRGGPHRVVPILAVAAVVLLAGAIVVGAIRWWTAQSARPDRLEIVALAPIGPFAVSGDDLPPDWPPNLVVGASLLRLDIAADPRRSSQVDAAGDTGAYVASGVRGVMIPAGEGAEVDVVIVPGDCGATSSAALAAPLVDSTGLPIPLSPAAAQDLRTAVTSLCDAGRPAPDVSANSARVDVFVRDRTLIMRVRISTVADRVVLQSRDSPAFRGLGDAEATVEDGVATTRLRWLVSPADALGLESPVVRVRAFAITNGRAYPWILDLRVPRGLAIPMPAPARNDGVDLAEVAPRPSD